MIPQALVERARRGAPDDLERFAALAWPHAYKLAYAILAERHAAEDAAQEACIAACRNLQSLRSAEAFRGWFARIVVREAKRTASRAPLNAEPDSARGHSAYGNDLAATIDLWRALDTLSQQLRTVVVLRYFEDLTSTEIGGVLGVPAGTVRFRLMTALRRLRPILDLPDAAPTLAAVKETKVQSHAC